jgi:hypothetical protein
MAKFAAQTAPNAIGAEILLQVVLHEFATSAIERLSDLTDL